MTFKQMFAKLEKKFTYGLLYGDEVPEERIATAEREIGLPFPKSYREMLSQCGWFKILKEDRQIWGLGDDLENHETVTGKTLSWRKVKEMYLYKDRGAHPFPPGMIVITGFESDIVVLDTNRMNNGECPVIISELGPKSNYHECSDFLDFIDYEFF
jgi:hypothetical protein